MSQEYKIKIYNPLSPSNVLWESEWCQTLYKAYQQCVSLYPHTVYTYSTFQNIHLGRNQKASQYIHINTQTTRLGKKTREELVCMCKSRHLSPTGNKHELTHKIINAEPFTNCSSHQLRQMCEEWCLGNGGKRYQLIKRLLRNSYFILSSEEDIPVHQHIITIFVFGKWDKKSKQLLPKYKKMIQEKKKIPYMMSIDQFTTHKFINEDDIVPCLLFVKNGILTRKRTQLKEL